MSYESKLMNLPISGEIMKSFVSDDAKLSYQLGHRDARHSASYIGAEADKVTAILRRIIASADECDVSKGAGVPMALIDARLIEEAREAMK